MAERAQSAARKGKGAHAPARCIERGAATLTGREDREGLRLRRTERQGSVDRSIRRKAAALPSSFHVDRRARYGLPDVLGSRRHEFQLRPVARAAGATRGYVRLRVSGALREERRVQSAARLDLPVLLICADDLSLRFSFDAG